MVARGTARDRQGPLRRRAGRRGRHRAGEPGRGRGRGRDRRLRRAAGAGRHRGGDDQLDADLRGRRQQRRVRHDRARACPRTRGDVFFDGLRGHRHRPVRQPARRPVPARGARLGGRVGRRPAAPVAQHAGRAGRARTTIVAANGVDADDVRVITPDVGGGFGAKITCYPEEALLGVIAQAGRPAAALAGDPQREHDGARSRAGAGAVRHDRRQPRRQGHPLPAARHPGLPAASPRWARSSPRS